MASTNRLQQWLRLKPIYIQRWMWEEAVRHEPKKYTILFPVYRGYRVIFT